MEQRIDSQRKKILEYMRNHNGITPMDALAAIGCFRLSARIKDLRDDGHVIDTVIEAKENEMGEVKRYARYFLIKEAPQ